MTNLQLVLASPQDIDTIYQLAEKIWNKHYVPIIGKGQVDYMLGKMYSVASLTEQMVDKRHRFFLVKDDDLNIGFISISGNEDMFIHKFYIDHDVQRKGYGRQTFQLIRNLFLDAKSFELTVNRQNYTAINFYFKLGFKIDRIEDFDIGNGFFMNDFIMKWTV